MNAEFNWWLLIVGLVFGAALVYLVLADSSRRESEIAAEEVPREATWIAATLETEGRPIDPETAERVLELHRYYLASPPPDEPEPEEPEPEPATPEPEEPEVAPDGADIAATAGTESADDAPTSR